MWLPELFNYQAKYNEIHPGAATICEAVAGVLRAEHNSTVRMTRELHETFGVEDVFASPMTPLEAASGCSGSTIRTQVYINALIIGVSDAIVPIFGSLVVNKVGKRNLLSTCHKPVPLS